MEVNSRDVVIQIYEGVMDITINQDKTMGIYATALQVIGNITFYLDEHGNLRIKENMPIWIEGEYNKVVIKTNHRIQGE